LLDPIRSANSEGACPHCNGAGVLDADLAMMAGVATTCKKCEGKRFQVSVLDHHLGGRDISEVLAMSVTEAEEFFGTGEARPPAAHTILDRLAHVGARGGDCHGRLGLSGVRTPTPGPTCRCWRAATTVSCGQDGCLAEHTSG
jgi:hypothetical protein